MMTESGVICREQIIKALRWYQLPDTESAIRLLCMIAAHESGDFYYIHQLKGPAIGLFQMEPRTYEDICIYIRQRQDDFPLLVYDMPQPVEYMAFNHIYATGISRVYLIRKPDLFPDPDDIEGLARYAKQHWNTPSGAALWTDYQDAWFRHFV